MGKRTLLTTVLANGRVETEERWWSSLTRGPDRAIFGFAHPQVMESQEAADKIFRRKAVCSCRRRCDSPYVFESNSGRHYGTFSLVRVWPKSVTGGFKNAFECFTVSELQSMSGSYVEVS